MRGVNEGIEEVWKMIEDVCLVDYGGTRIVVQVLEIIRGSKSTGKKMIKSI